MRHLASTGCTLFQRMLRQRKQDNHPDKDPNNAEASGAINNAADIVWADMKPGGANQLALAIDSDIVTTVDTLKKDLYFYRSAMKQRRDECEAMNVVVADAVKDASFWRNCVLEKESEAEYAEWDLAKWKKWAWETEAAARQAESDLASWKRWGSWIEEQHEAKQNVLLNQINEFKQREREAAGVPWAKKARSTY